MTFSHKIYTWQTKTGPNYDNVIVDLDFSLPVGPYSGQAIEGLHEVRHNRRLAQAVQPRQLSVHKPNNKMPR